MKSRKPFGPLALTATPFQDSSTRGIEQANRSALRPGRLRLHPERQDRDARRRRLRSAQCGGDQHAFHCRAGLAVRRRRPLAAIAAEDRPGRARTPASSRRGHSPGLVSLGKFPRDRTTEDRRGQGLRLRIAAEEAFAPPQLLGSAPTASSWPADMTIPASPPCGAFTSAAPRRGRPRSSSACGPPDPSESTGHGRHGASTVR